MEGFIHAEYLIAITFHIDTNAVVLKKHINMVIVFYGAAGYMRAPVHVAIFQGVSKQVLEDAFKVSGDIVYYRALHKVVLNFSIGCFNITLQGREYIFKYLFKLKYLFFLIYIGMYLNNFVKVIDG